MSQGPCHCRIRAVGHEQLLKVPTTGIPAAVGTGVRSHLTFSGVVPHLSASLAFLSRALGVAELGTDDAVISHCKKHHLGEITVHAMVCSCPKPWRAGG